MEDELPEKVAKFLSDLRRRCTEPTVKLYKYWLLSFNERSDSELDEITIEDVAEYIVFEIPGYAETTQKSVITALSSYIAHTQGDEPNRAHEPYIVKQQINIAVKTRRRELILKTGLRTTELNDLRNDTTGKTGSRTRVDVESLIGYLRHCDYGSRTHAIAEILLETGCRVKSLRQLNLDNVNFQQGTISIQSSETSAIPSRNREISLRDPCFDALETYVTCERIETEGDDATALFTTSRGRISATTIRRSIKQAGEKAFEYHTARNEIECPDDLREGLTSVSPRDFRSYALEQLED